MNRMRNWLKVLLIFLNLLSAVGLIVSAYAGMVDPAVTPVAGLLAMTFVIWICFSVGCLVMDLFLFRKLAWLQVVALCVCYGPIRTFCPINFNRDLSPEESSRSFRIMNYNVEGFFDEQARIHNADNRTMRYIIDSDADIVCLQECYEFKAIDRYGLQQAQIDSMLGKYPYHEVNRGGQAIFSKYPYVRIELPETGFDNGLFDAYTMSVDGHTLTIFNVHLQSIALTADDKRLYVDLTRNPSEDGLKQAKTQLLSKLCYGFKQRAVQARMIKKYIETIGGDIIVCGDFNDIPDCYAIRTIESTGLRDAYAEAGLGPAITYHADRFYFRIDHSLYRGSFQARKCVCGHVDSSDHYPLITTYLWN